MKKKIIRLTESDLYNIIKKSVSKIIKESTQDELVREQYQLWKTAKEFLAQKGFEPWDEYTDNPFMLTVRINEHKDVDLIDSMLSKYFGITSEYDMHVEYDSNMFGGDKRAVIYLPTPNKIQIMNK